MERKLSDIQILELAWDAQLLNWSAQDDNLARKPDSDFAKFREQREYEKLMEIEGLIKAAKARTGQPFAEA